MSDLRWLLTLAGAALFAFVFWFSRREADGKPRAARGAIKRFRGWLQRKVLSNSVAIGRLEPSVESATVSDSLPAEPERVVTIRLTGQANAKFAGELLLIALREAGLRHGKFGIFHRHLDGSPDAIVFSVASLVEPGSFDLTRIRSDRLPGVSFFLALPTPSDDLAAFDDMLATARQLASKLNGQLLDEHGSHLSVQRERFLREEVIEFQHRRAKD